MKFSNLCVDLSGVNERSNRSNVVTTQQIGDVEAQPPCDKGRKKKLFLSITVNGLIAATVCIILLLLEFDVILIRPSGFYCKDPKLSFKFTGDTVQPTVLVIMLLLIPIICVSTTEYLFTAGPREGRYRNSLRATIVTLRGFFLGLILSLLIVEMMKLIKRDPRPNFFDVCNPDAAKNCTEGQYIDRFECIPDSRFVSWYQHDASLSFPSGHTALSVHTALFLVWYLQRRAFSWSSYYLLVVPLAQCLCMLGAVVSSLTRISDHRHHWWDVLAGTVVGAVTAVYTLVVLCENFSYIEKEKEKVSNEKVILEPYPPPNEETREYNNIPL